MKLSLSTFLLTLAFTEAAPANLEKRATVQGFDISHYQGTVDFTGAYNSGARFVIIKVPFSLITVNSERSIVSNVVGHDLTHDIGHRGDHLPRSIVLQPLQRSNKCWPHPRRLSFRPPGLEHWQCTSNVLPGSCAYCFFWVTTLSVLTAAGRRLVW